jgi:hypothetical protein
MVLTLISERSETSWRHPDKKTIGGNRGPVYAFDLSNERMTRILYVHPRQFEVDEMSRLLGVRPQGLDAEEARVREILATVKVFKVDPGPKPTCIQDLRLGGGTGALLRPSR